MIIDGGDNGLRYRYIEILRGVKGRIRMFTN